MAQFQLSPVAEAATHPVLTVVNGKPTTTSMDVACLFGKRHDHVMRNIRALVEQLPAERAPNFGATFRDVPGPNRSTRREHYFVLTFDAFVLLAMGFTGPKALQVKLAYMDEFNRLQHQERHRHEHLSEQAVAEMSVELLALQDQHGKVQASQADTLRHLVKTQAEQIGLLKRVACLQGRITAREKIALAIAMERRGEPRDRIQQATGLSYNYLRQIYFRARAVGDLPAAVDPQVPLDLGVSHG